VKLRLILQITVFRQFFVTLNLPLKVTRGEIIVVQAVVFNYLESSVTVSFLRSSHDLNRDKMSSKTQQYQVACTVCVTAMI